MSSAGLGERLLDGLLRQAAASDERRADLEALVAGVLGDAALDDLGTRATIADGPRSGAVLTNLSDVQPESVSWLWPGRIPFGKLTVLDGDPGLGKSSVLIDVAARATIGSPMPDGSRSDCSGPVGAVILTAEDGLGDTIRPRFDAAGGDASRVVALRGVRCGEGGLDVRLPTVEDTAAIAEAVGAAGARLLIVDPLTAYLGDANAHRDADVRAALAGLARLAEDMGVAVVAIRHLNKSAGGNALYRGGGSIGIIAAARSGLLAAKDPEAPDSGRRILASTKSNLSAPPPSLAWSLDPAGDVVRVRWEGETAHTAAALLEAPDGEERTRRDEAADFLRAELEATREAPAKLLQARARDAGLTWRTVHRAADALGVEKVREGFGPDGQWVWRLPLSCHRGINGDERRDKSKGDKPLDIGDRGGATDGIYGDDGGRDTVNDSLGTSPIDAKAVGTNGTSPVSPGDSGHFRSIDDSVAGKGTPPDPDVDPEGFERWAIQNELRLGGEEAA